MKQIKFETLKKNQESNVVVGEKKNRPVYDALKESLGKIDITFEETPPSFKKDTQQTASCREQSVADFLKSYFPSDWSVKKGPIYDIEGNISNEVDCAICVSQHPPCRTPNRELILAEGVHSAIEVKPDISSLGNDKCEFARSLKQAVSVKRLKRTMTLINLHTRKSWPSEMHRIPYIVFSKKMSDFAKYIQFMLDQREKNSWSAWDMPDIVLSYREGLIYHAPDVSLCSISPLFKQHNLTSGEGYILFPTGNDTLVLFLILLYSFASPQPQVGKSILENYLFPMEIPGEMKIVSVIHNINNQAKTSNLT